MINPSVKSIRIAKGMFEAIIERGPSWDLDNGGGVKARKNLPRWKMAQKAVSKILTAREFKGAHIFIKTDAVGHWHDVTAKEVAGMFGIERKMRAKKDRVSI